MSIHGHCLCGTIQYEVRAPLEDVDHCHCSFCRRSHGAAFATYGRAAASDVEVRTGQDALRVYASSEPVKRSFCGECGSNLFYEHAALEGAIMVAVATLAETATIKPEAHIFVGSKAAWHTIDDDLPQHETFPPGVAD